MYSRILVPLDSSELAEKVLPHATQIAKGMNVPLALVRVIDQVDPELTDPRHGLYLDQVSLSLRTSAQEYLNKVASPLRDEGIEVTCEVKEGDVASRIIDEAESEPDTLIAMTTHGYSGVARWVMGSVTDKILRGSTNPVLVVRAN